MELKKIILATMGVAMSICAANAQQWKTNSYGLYSYPLTGNTSNVAIGITSSSTTANYKLYVKGNSKFTGSLRANELYSTTGFYSEGNFMASGSSNTFENGLTVYGGNSQNRIGLSFRKKTDSFADGMAIFAVGERNYSDLSLYANSFSFVGAYGSVNYMNMSNGKTNVLTDLDVTGKIKCHNELEVAEVLKANQIKAQDINVEMNNAADYVFDENYNLRSLSEVESFVKENKHLPGVPSAAEMAENGMSMSQMGNLLLEKVEELTLHMIELEKENKELKNRVQMLEK